MNEQRIQRPDLIERLPEREQEISRRLTQTFTEQGEELYLVGGVVRDLLLERGRADLDMATSATPQTTKLLGESAGADAIFTVGEAYGTIGLLFREEGQPDLIVEITTYRSEVYPTPDRRPEVKHGVSLIEDLSRRDFTINAIALQAETGELIDPFNGIGDLERRELHAVGDATQRFMEDPLRVLRAARFAAELDFEIGASTLVAMRETGPQIERVSRERIAAELNRLLVAPAVRRGLEVLATVDLIRHILPELMPMVEDDRDGGAFRHKDIWTHTLAVVEQSPPGWPCAGRRCCMTRPSRPPGRLTRVARCTSSATSWSAPVSRARCWASSSKNEPWSSGSAVWSRCTCGRQGMTKTGPIPRYAASRLRPARSSRICWIWPPLTSPAPEPTAAQPPPGAWQDYVPTTSGCKQNTPSINSRARSTVTRSCRCSTAHPAAGSPTSKTVSERWSSTATWPPATPRPRPPLPESGWPSNRASDDHRCLHGILAIGPAILRDTWHSLDGERPACLNECNNEILWRATGAWGARLRG